MKISVVIPTVNDQEELLATIRSIRQTAPTTQIVVIDDCSAYDVVVPDDLNVVLHRNFYRIGSGGSRHVGAQIADGDYLVMTDSHVRFEDGWVSDVMSGIMQYPDALFCGVCKGFTPKVKPFGQPAGTYYGADLQFIGKQPDGSGNQVLEGVWAGERDDMEEISCVMGANYVMPRKRFLELGGMNHFRVWGVEEQLMSLKFWLSGSDVRLMKNFVTWHRFRDGEKLPFHNSLWTLIYNKLFLIETMFPRSIADRMIAALPRCFDTNQAVEKLREDWRLVELERERNKSLFVNDIEWLLKKFEIPLL